MRTSKKTFCHANCAAPPEKFRVFSLNCTTDGPKIIFGCAFQNALLLIVQLGCLHPSERDCRLLLVHNFNVPRYYHKKPAKKLSKVTNVTEVKSSSYTYFPFFTGLHQNKFSAAKYPDKMQQNLQQSSNNSQCDDTCNSKACAYDNLDCNEKLRKLVS